MYKKRSRSCFHCIFPDNQIILKFVSFKLLKNVSIDETSEFFLFYLVTYALPKTSAL